MNIIPVLDDIERLCNLGEVWQAMGLLQKLREELRKAPARCSALEKFGAVVIEEARSELGDLDGGWLQDKAVECGVLESVTALALCGDDCRCAELDDFPQECFQYTEEVRAVLTPGAGAP